MLPLAFKLQDPQRVCADCFYALVPLQAELAETNANSLRHNEVWWWWVCSSSKRVGVASGESCVASGRRWVCGYDGWVCYGVGVEDAGGDYLRNPLLNSPTLSTPLPLTRWRSLVCGDT
jgi:hypothetical protein